MKVPIILLLSGLCLAGAAAQVPPVGANAEPSAETKVEASAADPTTGGSFSGLASWYGGEFHGRKTANGELFDKEGLTAAHRTLPFGTLLRVSNLDTGASVVVRVNDRGPFVGERVLDLSEGAARLIGLLATGTARVSCRVLPPEEAAAFGAPGPSLAPASRTALPPPETPLPVAATCRIQVASYRELKNAEATVQRLRMAGLSPAIETAGAFHRVVFPNLPAPDADGVAERLRSLGYRDLLVTWSRPAGK